MERRLAKWQEMTGLSIKPASNIAEASIHAQIRDRLYATKDRVSFVERFAGDPVVASAILTARSSLFSNSRGLIARAPFF